MLCPCQWDERECTVKTWLVCLGSNVEDILLVFYTVFIFLLLQYCYKFDKKQNLNPP
jgi:hypothetical protein